MLNSDMSSTINNCGSMLHRMVKTENVNRIREARQAAGMSQAQLAQAVNVSRAAVSQWETGDIKSLRPDNLFAVARAVRCSPEWLGTGTGAKHSLGLVDDVLLQLSDEDRKAVLDFIEYKINRISGGMPGAKMGHYVSMIEKIKADMDLKKKT